MKHVVITGASRGLGRAMTMGFAADGWTVSGCGTDANALQSLAQELGPDHLLQTCDVTDPATVEKFAATATKRFGAPDLLLNNAATINPNQPLWVVSANEFSRVIDVNLKGVHLIIRAFVPGMIERGKGVMVNFSSGWGRSTSPEVAAYCATKWGIEGLTAALAQELPAGLAAVALNPGIIGTRMLRSCFGEGAGSYPTPEEWAKVAVPYLTSFSTRHNGKALTVPGM
jgi:NAD(P)-dependent dehydrogenase (short-subunit alcohol dehydrogenase family)